jgi:hypothetical protein
MRRHLMSALQSLAVLLSAVVSTDAASYTFKTVDVPFPGAHDTGVAGINNRGVLTGLYLDPASQDLGFTKVRATFRLIPLLNPHHINQAQHFTGWYDSRSGLLGFLYRGTEFLTIHVPGSNLTEAIGLNDHDEVVGDYRDAQGFHAFLFQAGTGTGIYTTVDPPFPSFSGYGATGINNAGVIVGGFDEHGYLDDHGTFTQIDVPGATFTLPRGINNAGVIAGVYCVAEACHGFTLDNGHFMTVDVPGATLTDIFAINDHGQLVGHYIDTQGSHHGFVATPDETGEHVPGDQLSHRDTRDGH